METAKRNAGELVDALAFRRDRFGLVADVFAREAPEPSVSGMLEQARAYEGALDESIEAKLNEGLRVLPCEDLPAFATQTRTEYARLFLGPRDVKAPLHESAYLSGAVRMFTAETLAVRAFYEQHGYVMKAKNREPEDGMGVELEFLRNLCDRCLALLEADGGAAPDALGEVRRLLEAQKSFKEQHLHRWAEAFVQRVVDNDQSGFYAAWAAYLLGVLREDDELLDECLELLSDAERACPTRDFCARSGVNAKVEP